MSPSYTLQMSSGLKGGRERVNGGQQEVNLGSQVGKSGNLGLSNSPGLPLCKQRQQEFSLNH